MREKIVAIIGITLCIYLVSFNGGVYAADTLTIVTCECPPLSYTLDGALTGPAVEITRRIQHLIESHDEILVQPWARGYKLVQKTPNVVLFSMTRTAERDTLFKWVGPFAEKRFAFHAKKGSSIQLSTLEDAQQYSIGVMRGSNNEEFLRTNGFTNIENVTVEEQNVKKLLSGKIDLWYTDTAMSSMMEADVTDVYTTQTSQSYYAFNSAAPDSTVDAWQTALETLHNEGAILEILQQYNLEALYPTVKD